MCPESEDSVTTSSIAKECDNTLFTLWTISQYMAFANMKHAMRQKYLVLPLPDQEVAMIRKGKNREGETGLGK